MQGNWNDPGYVDGWEDRAAKTNPTRAMQIAIMANLVGELTARDAKGTVLIPGAGAGALDAAVLERCPHVRLVAIERAPEMIRRYRQRMARHLDRITLYEGDILSVMERSVTPGSALAVLCLQVMHAFSPAQAETLFAYARRALAAGGVLAIADRFAIPAAKPIAGHKAVWATVAPEGREPFDQRQRRLAEKTNHVPNIIRTLSQLETAGFDTDLPFKVGDRAIVVGEAQRSRSSANAQSGKRS